jgi:hypothetical protein
VLVFLGHVFLAGRLMFMGLNPKLTLFCSCAVKTESL